MDTLLASLRQRLRRSDTLRMLWRASKRSAAACAAPFIWLVSRAMDVLSARARSRPRQERTVVFVAPQVSTRVLKIAHGLRKSGWRVVLLAGSPLAPGEGAFFDQVERYRFLVGALRAACRHRPMVYHLFLHGADFRPAEVFLRARPGPVVLDYSHVIVGNYRPGFIAQHYANDLDRERRALETADGIVCRDLETQYAKKTLGYRFRRRILFPDGCWGDADLSTAAAAPDSGIHVGSCGELASAPATEGRPPRDIYPLVEAMTRDGIDFHLFLPPYCWNPGKPGPADRFLELAKRTRHMHFHGSLPPGELERALRSCTFGLHVVDETLHLGDDHPVLERRHADLTLSRRFFTYLDSGLPVIVHDGRHTRALCKRYGIGVVADPALRTTPGEWLRKLAADTGMRARVLAARQALSVVRHAPRLIDFYLRAAGPASPLPSAHS